MVKYDNRRKYAYNLFNAVPGVSMKMPEATFCIWVNVSKLGTSTEITKYLIDEAKVNVNDGKFYGSMGEGHLRVVTGCFWDCFDALDRMADAFRKLGKEKGIA